MCSLAKTKVTANNLIYVQVKTMEKVKVSLKGMAVMFSEECRKSDVIPEYINFPGLDTGAQKLHSRGRGRM